MQAHEILREAINILRVGWSQNASARDAGGVPVPLFTGDVAAVNPAAVKLSAYGAIVKAQYSSKAWLRTHHWDLIYRRAATQVPHARSHPLLMFNDMPGLTVEDMVSFLEGCAKEIEAGVTVEPPFRRLDPKFQEMKP